MLDAIIILAAAAIVIGVAYGLVYWAHRAETDRSAFVGLYLIYGMPGLLLVVAGAALLANSRESGFIALGIGLGLTLPLVPQVRRALARVTPIDPASRTDMSGLCIMLAVLGLLLAITARTPEPEEVASPVTAAALVAQLAAFVGLSYVVVGLGIRRSFRQATRRLGVFTPSPAVVGIAVAMVIPSFIVAAIAGGLTHWLQPEISDQIQEGLYDLTAYVRSPLGAVLIGFTAGVGEELLFRGALQPRFGIVLTSLVFALLHTNYGLSFVTLGVFSLGLILGEMRKRYGTVAPMVTHGVYNMIAVLISTYA